MAGGKRNKGAAGKKGGGAAASAAEDVEKEVSPSDVDEMNVLEDADRQATYRTASGVLMSHKLARDIKIDSVTVSLHGTDLLKETQVELIYGRRYGLLGLNGCGKSTLLKCLGYRELPIPDSMDIYLLQREAAASSVRALDAVLGDLARRVERLEARASELSMTEEGAESEELFDLYDQIDSLQPARAQADAAKLLHGLGFTHEMMNRPCKDFSGGWRMRIALARALFLRPTILLLDEPTNHLDLEACVWLEEYLKKWKSILMLISHSQDFMNGVCNSIVHMHLGRLKYYTGDYDSYIKSRFELEVNQMKQFKWEQQQMQQIKDFVAKFGHGSKKLARQAQSRQKLLEKMQAGGLTSSVTRDKTVTLSFEDIEELPPPVLMFDKVAFGYSPEKILFSGMELGVDMDSRVAVVGPNGVGKTTLLKLMSGSLLPVEGMVRRHNRLRLGWYRQHLAEVMDPDLSPVEYLMRQFPDVKEPSAMRQAVGRFGITGPAQVQPIRTLSDGMRCRVVFAMLAWQQPHILLLDEPTNHLDMETIDALADAINDWNGGLVLVSHDFRLIHQVAEEIWLCEGGSVKKYEGTIEEYKELLRQRMFADEEMGMKK